MSVIQIKKEQEGKRVDLVLMEILPNLTRSTIKKIIIDGKIKVKNNELENENVMPNYRVQEADIIDIDNPEIRKFVKEGDNEASQIKPRKMDLEVIYEDEYLLAVNKPSGIQSHPVQRYDNTSLLSGLYYHVQNQNKFEKGSKIRLVHRLDKDTSGIIIATKDLNAHDFYSKQFETRNVTKEYYAIIKGDFLYYLEKFKKSFLNISTYIGKSPKDDKKYINTQPKKGKVAKTNVYFEDFFNKFGKRKFSLVKVIPETGRTHQIRVHLSSIGFPILGDSLYGGQKYKRLMLHAYSLTIPLFKSKDEITLIAALPEEMEWENYPDKDINS